MGVEAQCLPRAPKTTAGAGGWKSASASGQQMPYARVHVWGLCISWRFQMTLTAG